jgi:catalase-peroxidase
MAYGNVEETVAPIAGGHTLETHGAADPNSWAGASIEEQSLGWKNTYGTETVQIQLQRT